MIKTGESFPYRQSVTSVKDLEESSTLEQEEKRRNEWHCSPRKAKVTVKV